MRQRVVIAILSSLILCVFGGCQRLADRYYRFNEGQLLSEKKLNQLQVGQTKRRVAALLGLPVSESAFDKNHWYYVTHQKSNSQEITKSFVVQFDSEDRVRRISKIG